MLTVSDEYKRLIKEPIREIKPFVEINITGGTNIFTIASGDELYIPIEIISNSVADITNLDYGTPYYDPVADTIRTTAHKPFLTTSLCYKYASLEHNYFQLDGSFVLPNRQENESVGFVGDVGSAEFTIAQNPNKPRVPIIWDRQFTVYFNEEYATNFDINVKAYYYDSTNHTGTTETFNFSYSDNNKMTINVEIPKTLNTYNFENITEIQVIVNNWINPEHRVRIKNVVGGTRLLLEDNEIINIKSLEQTDLYTTSTPNNSLDIEINNYDRKFNLLVTDNILNKLSTDKTVVDTYLRIGTEYILLGSYLFKEYTNNKNLTTQISCEGAIEKLDERDFFHYNQIENIATDMKNYGHRYYITKYKNVLPLTTNYNPALINAETKRDFVQALALYTQNFIVKDRNAKIYVSVVGEQAVGDPKEICLNKLENTLCREFSLKDQLGYPKIVRYAKTKEIEFNYDKLTNTNNDPITIYESEYDVPIPSEGTIWKHYEIEQYLTTPIDINTIKLYAKINSEYIELDSSWFNSYSTPYILAVDVNTMTPTPHQIKFTAKPYENYEIKVVVQNPNVNTGATITINDNLINNNTDINRVSNYLFSLDKDYEFELEVMGDPSLEPGDLIRYETENGWQEGRIISIDTTYNGGLTAIIKGVSSNVLQ